MPPSQIKKNKKRQVCIFCFYLFPFFFWSGFVTVFRNCQDLRVVESRRECFLFLPSRHIDGLFLFGKRVGGSVHTHTPTPFSRNPTKKKKKETKISKRFFFFFFLLSRGAGRRTTACASSRTETVETVFVCVCVFVFVFGKSNLVIISNHRKEGIGGRWRDAFSSCLSISYSVVSIFGRG